MREIIKDWLKKMEFLTGLKQFREMPLEDAKMMIDFLEAKVKEYSWMTESRLNQIFKAGMEGVYGDFYSMNVRTLSTWCNTFYEHHKQQILVEQFPKSEAQEQSQEEIEKWLEIGRQNFREKWEAAKKGHIDDLWLWGPNMYRKMIQAGVLKESDYPYDDEYNRKLSRFEKGFAFTDTMFASKKEDNIWKRFVKDCVKNNIDLTQYI